MKVRNLLFPLLIVAFPAVGAAQDDDAAALDALSEGYVAHFNLGHADMVAEMYADSAVTLFANGSVNLGREEIAAGLAESMASSGELGINRDELHLAGDNAVARGTWSSTTAVEGADPVVVSGHYMTWFVRVEGDWKIMVVTSNYDSPQAAEAYMGAVSANVDDMEDDGLDGLLTAYEEAFAAGDASAISWLYTENAHASFPDQAPLEGRSAIEANLAERVNGTLDIHAKGTMDFGDGWVVNGGWYEIMGDDGHNAGSYLLLAQATEDGGHQIHWLLSNGRPVPEETEESEETEETEETAESEESEE